ncbi:MAG: DUF1553 domain-containing protein [Planctomycetaceae bacterium]
MVRIVILLLIVSPNAGQLASAADPIRWSFDEALPVAVHGELQRATGHLQSPAYPEFGVGNHVLRLSTPSWIQVPDPGDQSAFDFDNGDEITLEAWVNVRTIAENAYLVGKGRSAGSGANSLNQNWALRLRKSNGKVCLNFLFRSRSSDDHPGDWHRWTSTQGFSNGSRWHHVAISYRFGEPESVRGFVDGKRVTGKWDMGGATVQPPVVDNDDVWIGSAMGGVKSNSLDGAIDNIAIHHRVVPEAELVSRFQWNPPPVEPPEMPPGQVVVQLFGPLPSHTEIPAATDSPLTQWHQDAAAFVRLPHKYDSWGIREDWGETVLVRAWADISLPAGEYQLLARSRGMSCLKVDGESLLVTPGQRNYSSAHHTVSDLPTVPVLGMRPHAMSDNEKIVPFHSDGGVHRFQYDMIVGGPQYRVEFGETCLAIAHGDGMFHLLSGGSQYPLTDEGWQSYVDHQSAELSEADTAVRRTATPDVAAKWSARHRQARNHLLTQSAAQSIDELTDRGVNDAELPPLIDDYTFLRRIFIDTVGVPPTLEEISAYFDTTGANPDPRGAVVNRLLQDPRWADNWVGYWQDVFAENPNLLKPTLNNTGPFRYWIHEALTDNKPVDRFATELIMMRGSTWGGGAAGFAVASQNDVPMAAKAHVISSAFLGINLKCARCHDAPYHPWKQSDLFQLAAMLDRRTLNLPPSSTVPAAFFDEQERESLIEVSLMPGAEIPSRFPFAELTAPVDETLLLQPDDTRERLALQITSSRRFAEVIANRVWKRLMGTGLVEPVDDWEDQQPSDPELLATLTDTLIRLNYDLKEFARVIFCSQAYQRQVIDDLQQAPSIVAPSRRRMSAEQIVDSAFHSVGKRMKTEQLTLDVEGTLPANRFLNFGFPQRAWEFTTLANERDRPSLALPRVQAVIDVLKAFGWRNSRPEPVSQREETPNLIQPGVLANGTLGVWLTRLTDDSGLTRRMREDQTVDELVEQLFLAVLTRPPTSAERSEFVALLSPGYDSRLIPTEDLVDPSEPQRFRYVSWSNHLNSEANVIKVQMQEAVRQGPPPTRYLTADWRQRAEDAVWSLLNSPELIVVP